MGAAALHISGLEFSYGPQPSARTSGDFSLRLPALELAPAEQVLLAAPSGAGKSTLLSLIAGLLDPHAGSVSVAGQNIHALRGAARDRFRGRAIGLVFQSLHLFTGFTARENVIAAMLMAGLPRQDHDPKARALLQQLGIERIHAPVEELSLGQQQRVAVARALACDPALVLADEPTASLDPANAALALAMIQDACRARGAALLCVSHDPALTQRFHRTVALAPPNGSDNP